MPRRANVLLSPVGDLLRNPYWGRTNESPSEDPIMTANYLSRFTKVVQDHDVIATLKHYLAYNQETNRSGGGNNIVSTRALREVYALPTRPRSPTAIPAASCARFNKVNGDLLLREPGDGARAARQASASPASWDRLRRRLHHPGSLAGGVDIETGNRRRTPSTCWPPSDGTVPESLVDLRPPHPAHDVPARDLRPPAL